MKLSPTKTEENKETHENSVIVDQLNLAIENTDGKILYQLLQALAPIEEDLTIPACPTNGLAFQGGGPKGGSYNLIGEILDEMHITEHVKAVCGASAGAINALGYALGFNGVELKTLSNSIDFLDLLDPMESLSQNEGGVFSGKNFHHWCKMICLGVLGNADATLGDLKKAIDQEKIVGLKHLTVTTTLLLKDGDGNSIQKLKIFSSMNEEQEKVKIADAVRASMSIPGAYYPFNIIATDGEDFGIYVDGGVLNNFPIELLDHDDFTKTHLGVDYHLVKKTNDQGEVVCCNPGTLGFSLVREIKNTITNTISNFEQKSESKNKGVKEKKAVQQRKIGEVNFYDIYEAISTGLDDQSANQDLDKKFTLYSDNIVQVISTLELSSFAATKQEIENEAKVGREATRNFLKKRDPAQVYDASLVTVNELTIEEYIALLEGELLKYHTCALENIYVIENLKQNAIIRFVSKQMINHLKKQESSSDSFSPELYLQEKIELFKTAKKLKIASYNQAREIMRNVTDDQVVLQNIINVCEKNQTDKFNVMINGQLTRIIELCNTPIISHNHENLLQILIKNKYFENAKLLIAVLNKSYEHRDSLARKTLAWKAGKILPSLEGKRLFDIINQNHKMDDFISKCETSSENYEFFKYLNELQLLAPLKINNEGYNLLHLAIRGNNFELFKLLLSFINESIDTKRYKTKKIPSSELYQASETLFEFCLREGSVELIKKLISDNACLTKLFDKSKVIDNQYTMEELLVKKIDGLENKFELWDCYYCAANPLLSKIPLFSSKSKLENILQEIKRKDSIVTEQNKIIQSAQNGMQLLAASEKLYELMRDFKDEEEKTLFHHLAKNTNTTKELYQELYCKVFRSTNSTTNLGSLNVPDMYGKTPFHYLVDNNRIDIVEKLLNTPIVIALGPMEKNPDLDELFNLSCTSEEYAEKLTQLEYVEAKNPALEAVLSKHGADFKVKQVMPDQKQSYLNYVPSLSNLIEKSKEQLISIPSCELEERAIQLTV